MHPYGSFSSLAPRNASAHGTFVGWQVSALYLQDDPGHVRSLPSEVYTIDRARLWETASDEETQN